MYYSLGFFVVVFCCYFQLALFTNHFHSEYWKTGTLAKSVDPDEMSALFAKINTIFRDINTSFKQNLFDNPIKVHNGQFIRIVSICMG